MNTIANELGIVSGLIGCGGFNVLRHSGRDDGGFRARWRRNQGEAKARDRYAKDAEALRQGCVKLVEVNDDGKVLRVLRQTSGPRLRSWW